jgi:hypothetical protein
MNTLADLKGQSHGMVVEMMSTINQPSAFVRFRLFYLAEFTLKPCLLD